jgi:hypothetical protein
MAPVLYPDSLTRKGESQTKIGCGTQRPHLLPPKEYFDASIHHYDPNAIDYPNLQDQSDLALGPSGKTGC